MQESKNDVLKKLKEIHTSLLENEKFMPYNFNAIIVWGVVAIFLFIFASNIFKISIIYGSIFLIVFLGFGALVEYFLIKNENKKYDMPYFNKLQNFVEKVYVINIIFGIFLTIIFVQSMLIDYIYIIWIFLIGSAGYIAGFSINSKLFTYHSIISISVAFTLFILSTFFNITIFNQLAAIVVIGFGYIYLGIRLKRESNDV